jgi:hypothetical protein
MNNFWFSFVNGAGTKFQTWSFLDSGNYFEMAPFSSRREENQYDISDRFSVLVDNKVKATIALNGLLQWMLLEGGGAFEVKTNGQQVTLTCKV